MITKENPLYYFMFLDWCFNNQIDTYKVIISQKEKNDHSSLISFVLNKKTVTVEVKSDFYSRVEIGQKIEISYFQGLFTGIEYYLDCTDKIYC